MYSYAQINIQLYNQMRRREYSQSEISAVHQIYLRSLDWMGGRFRPSGKPLQDHLIGTASILAERRAPLKFLIVAILHAVHSEGDFGAMANLSASAKHTILQNLLDDESETLLAAYLSFAWNTQAILRAAENFDQLNAIERDVIFLRLANDLEDNLDEAILFCANRDERLKYLKTCGPAMVKLARILKQDSLAEELSHSHAAHLGAENLSIFPVVTPHNSSWVAAPRSHRKTVLHTIAPPLLHNAGRAARKIRRALGGKN